MPDKKSSTFSSIFLIFFRENRALFPMSVLEIHNSPPCPCPLYDIITFLSPNKKVTKEIGTREALRANSALPCVSLPPLRAELPCKNRNILCGTGCRLRCSSGVHSAGRKILKRAALIAGAINSAPLKSASLGYLSCRNKKGTNTIF